MVRTGRSEFGKLPLQQFRVHEVERSANSSIPVGRVVIVLDIGDSPIAPHQAGDSKLYYYRQGGRSVPAPHFYLETLRNRLVNPELRVQLTGFRIVAVIKTGEHVFVEGKLRFVLTNIGRVAAYKWELFVESFSGCHSERQSDYLFDPQSFPERLSPRIGGIPLDISILPSLQREVERDFGFFSSHDGTWTRWAPLLDQS